MKPQGVPAWASVALLSGLLGLVGVVALAIGSVSVPVERTIAILLHQLHLTDDVTWTPMQATIILQVRFPRVLMAALVGGALFLILADLVARVLVRPQEVWLGIITAFVGVPFFLYLLRTHRRGLEPL